MKVLTVRNAGSDQAGGSGHHVGSSEGKPSADAFNCEQDEEGGGELHQTRDEEADVDVSHDEALVNHGTGEPARTDRSGCWS